ncbi:MAG: hypothetical protein AB1774_03035 [Bacillota bacterium]
MIDGVRMWSVKGVISVLLLAGILFLLSGRPDWGMGWAYLGMVVVVQALTALRQRQHVRHRRCPWNPVQRQVLQGPERAEDHAVEQRRVADLKLGQRVTAPANLLEQRYQARQDIREQQWQREAPPE